MKKHDYYKSPLTEVKLTPHYLTLKIKKRIKRINISKDDGYMNDSIWIIQVGDESIGIYCTDKKPILEQGCITEHRNGDMNTLRIPLRENYISTNSDFWMRKAKYRRPTWIKDYWKAKMAA